MTEPAVPTIYVIGFITAVGIFCAAAWITDILMRRREERLPEPHHTAVRPVFWPEEVD